MSGKFKNITDDNQPTMNVLGQPQTDSNAPQQKPAAIPLSSSGGAQIGSQAPQTASQQPQKGSGRFMNISKMFKANQPQAEKMAENIGGQVKEETDEITTNIGNLYQKKKDDAKNALAEADKMKRFGEDVTKGNKLAEDAPTAEEYRTYQTGAGYQPTVTRDEQGNIVSSLVADPEYVKQSQQLENLANLTKGAGNVAGLSNLMTEIIPVQSVQGTGIRYNPRFATLDAFLAQSGAQNKGIDLREQTTGITEDANQLITETMPTELEAIEKTIAPAEEAARDTTGLQTTFDDTTEELIAKADAWEADQNRIYNKMTSEDPTVMLEGYAEAGFPIDPNDLVLLRNANNPQAMIEILAKYPFLGQEVKKPEPLSDAEKLGMFMTPEQYDQLMLLNDMLYPTNEDGSKADGSFDLDRKFVGQKRKGVDISGSTGLIEGWDTFLNEQFPSANQLDNTILTRATENLQQNYPDVAALLGNDEIVGQYVGLPHDAQIRAILQDPNHVLHSRIKDIYAEAEGTFYNTLINNFLSQNLPTLIDQPKFTPVKKRDRKVGTKGEAFVPPGYADGGIVNHFTNSRFRKFFK